MGSELHQAIHCVRRNTLRHHHGNVAFDLVAHHSKVWSFVCLCTGRQLPRYQNSARCRLQDDCQHGTRQVINRSTRDVQYLLRSAWRRIECAQCRGGSCWSGSDHTRCQHNGPIATNRPDESMKEQRATDPRRELSSCACYHEI